MICIKCGAEYPDDAVNCPFCESAENEAETKQETEVVPAVEETNVVPVVKNNNKKRWTVIGIVAAIIVIAVTALGVVSNLCYTTSKDTHASVYVITKKGMDRVYVKAGNGESYLIKELGEGETFREKNEFVVKNNNVYFLDDDGGLSLMNMKNGKTKVIGDDFKAGTIVLSAKGDVVLYVGEDGVLYKTTRGGKAKEVAEIGESKFENLLPTYGFVEGTNKVWYAPREENGASSSVYLESGDNLAEKVASVFHVGDDGKTVVYSTVTKEETIQPEVDESATEETQKAEPTIVRSYALMLKEEGKDAEVLSDNLTETDVVSILHKEHKGVLYIADKVEQKEEEMFSAPKGTLYFREFGGEKIKLDSEVTIGILLEDMGSNNYYYDASDRAEDETIAYMKEDTISLIKDMKKVENPKEFEFLSSNPVFEHDNTFVMYNSYNPKPAQEQPAEEAAEETAEETAEEKKDPVKFVYSSFKDGAWSDYTVVAEDVVDYRYDEDGKKIYYLLNDKDDAENLSLYCYSVDKAESVLVTEGVLGYVTTTNKGKNLYYVNNYNSETQSASVTLRKNGKDKVVAEQIAGCLIVEDGTPYFLVPDGDDSDLYFAVDGRTELVCKNMKEILYVR